MVDYNILEWMLLYLHGNFTMEKLNPFHSCYNLFQNCLSLFLMFRSKNVAAVSFASSYFNPNFSGQISLKQFFVIIECNPNL